MAAILQFGIASGIVQCETVTLVIGMPPYARVFMCAKTMKQICGFGSAIICERIAIHPMRLAMVAIGKFYFNPNAIIGHDFSPFI